MKPFRRLGEATAPDGTILALFEHDGAYVIRVNGIELMSTRRHNSEDALAELVCAPLADKRNARVLVGGLGLGFTLKTALRLLAPDATVMVAEIVQAVIDWNRNVDYPLAHEALADARVEMRHDDVARVLRHTYEPIVERRRDEAFTQAHRDFQLVRRGRYVEFNLVHDRGTIFGLQTQARIESVLMSLPPLAMWQYAPRYAPDSFEAQLVQMLEPRDWAADATGE